MRQVDEITERAPAPSLPAPAGPRLPTSQVPVTLTTPVEPSTTSENVTPEVPTLPRLAPAAPKPTGPPTGQVATTSLSLDAFLAANAGGTGVGKPASEPEKKTHKVLIVFGGLMALILVLAVIFRNSAIVERFTGKGYDTNPLPTHAAERPIYTGADFMITTQSVSMVDGIATNYWETQHDVVNYSASAARLTYGLAKAAVIGGTIGTPHDVGPKHDVMIDQQGIYDAGDTPSDPWVHSPPEPGWYSETILSPDTVLMYQDVIDPAMRTLQPTSVVTETRHDTPVTTYNYSFAFGDFYESAPRLFELVRVVNGNAADDATVTVAVSLDDQWMVRYLDVNVDYRSVIDHTAKKVVDQFFPYRYTMDLASTTAAPESLPMPDNVIEATTTTPTTTTPPTLPTVPVVTP